MYEQKYNSLFNLVFAEIILSRCRRHQMGLASQSLGKHSQLNLNT